MGSISFFTAIILGLWFYFIKSVWVPFGLYYHTLYRPLASGLFVGLLMGDPVQGTIIGANINLVYIGYMSVGGSSPGDPALAGVVGTALALASHLSPEQALVLSVPVGLLGGMLDTFQMTIKSIFPHRMEDACCKEGNLRKMTFIHICPPELVRFAATFPVVFLGCYFGAPAVEAVVNGIPQAIMNGLTLVGTLMPALGICLNLRVIAKKDTLPFYFLGFFAVLYFELSIIGVTVFGVIIAILRFVSFSRSSAPMASEQPEEGQPELELVTPEQHVKLSKKDVRHSFIVWRWFTFACYNYEGLMSMGFAQCMAKLMQKLYPDPEQFKVEMKRHFAFFNTEPNVGTIVHGVTIAMEEQRANGAPITAESISAVKTGLMGPMAGIGDTITQGITTPIMLSIGISMALQGNIMGPIVFVVLNGALILCMSYAMWMYGYRLGSAAVERLIAGGLMQQLMIAAGTLGCLVLGALTATTVAISTPIAFTIGVSEFALQAGLFDQILPGLLPLAFTMITFWLVQKNWTANKILLLIFVFGLATGTIGIFA